MSLAAILGGVGTARRLIDGRRALAVAAASSRAAAANPPTFYHFRALAGVESGFGLLQLKPVPTIGRAYRQADGGLQGVGQREVPCCSARRPCMAGALVRVGLGSCKRSSPLALQRCGNTTTRLPRVAQWLCHALRGTGRALPAAQGVCVHGPGGRPGIQPRR
jgi:hypothetical protein